MKKTMTGDQIKEILTANGMKMTGDSFRLTPEGWGEQYIMYDEDEALDTIRETFPEADLDDQFDRPCDVEIAVDENGQHYALNILYDQFIIYAKKCDNPDTAQGGLFDLQEYRWNQLDDAE